MTKTGIVILAAGNSSRLGRPKQLLPYQGKTLLRHVVDEARSATLWPVVVVTGAYEQVIQDSLQGQEITLVYNPQWETGMASGIAAGMAKLLALEPDATAVILAVCDQPYISAGLFRSLMDNHSVSKKGLIGCEYSGIVGTPVLVDIRYFSALSLLSGESGARNLLKRHPEDIASVSFPKGSIDIDTEEDFRNI